MTHEEKYDRMAFLLGVDFVRGFIPHKAEEATLEQWSEAANRLQEFALLPVGQSLSTTLSERVCLLKHVHKYFTKRIGQ